MGNKPHRFTAEEIEYLRSHYGKQSNADIAAALGRTKRSIDHAGKRYGLSVKRRWWTPEEADIILKRWHERVPMSEVAAELGRSFGEVCRKANLMGIRSWHHDAGYDDRGRFYIGHLHGKRVYEHRYLMEKELGRPLKSNEIVHHIDGDRKNNDITNLYLCETRAKHRIAHSSYEKLLTELVQKGYVEFDRATGVYKVCKRSK